MTTTYLLLFRGMNVGGKNIVPMAKLKACLESLGYTKVTTYIASGNVVLQSSKRPAAIQSEIERAVPKALKLDSALMKVLVLTRKQLQTVVDTCPSGFGQEPKKYHSDVIFLMGIDVKRALAVCDPRPGVDAIWPGTGVIYSRRLSALRTKSRLKNVMSSPLYKSMTIRTWGTTVALYGLMRGPVEGKAAARKLTKK